MRTRIWILTAFAAVLTVSLSASATTVPEALAQSGDAKYIILEDPPDQDPGTVTVTFDTPVEGDGTIGYDIVLYLSTGTVDLVVNDSIQFAYHFTAFQYSGDTYKSVKLDVDSLSADSVSKIKITVYPTPSNPSATLDAVQDLGTDNYAEYSTHDGAVTAYPEGPAVIDVDIDIKPGSTPNTINLGSNGVIPVAILSSEGFDARDVDPETVQLEGKAGVRVKGNGDPQAIERDVNGDGVVDLEVKIEVENLEPGDIQDGEAEVTGSTMDGQDFVGTDLVTIVPS